MRPAKADVEAAHDKARAAGRARVRSLVVLAVALTGFGARLPGQVPAAPPASAESPTAAEVLAKAIARQGMPTGCDAAANLPLALRTTVSLQFRDERGNDVAVEAERRFLAPNLIWTRAEDTFSKNPVWTGFDGTKPWFFSRKSGLKDLSGPDGAHDLKQLEEDVELTALLARSFLLRNLGRELRDAHRIADVTAYGMTAWVVEGAIDFTVKGEKKPATLRLFIEQKEARLMGAQLAAAGEEPLVMCFTKHETVDGVDVPRKIEVYRGAAKQPQVTLYVKTLELAPKLGPADFTWPK